MSRNSKNAQRTQQRKEWSARRKNGNPGPKSTTPKHGKVHRKPRNVAKKKETEQE